MRIAGLILFLSISVLLTSCSMNFNAYIRNNTDRQATVDVYLLNKENLPTLPNKIKVANQVVPFKCVYRKHIDSLQNVVWIDTNHFKLELAPNTTVDLTDMVGKVVNGSFRQEVLVTVSVGNRIDTIIKGSGQSYGRKFEYKSMGFGTPIIFHDIK